MLINLDTTEIVTTLFSSQSRKLDPSACMMIHILLVQMLQIQFFLLKGEGPEILVLNLKSFHVRGDKYLP